MSDYVCECTHQKPRHAGGRYACQDCPCKGYTPDFQASERSGDDEVEPFTVPCSELALDFGGESTSARLRRVEQERDELATALDREHGLMKRAESDRSLLRAELASARTELEQVRRERDNAYAANGDLLVVLAWGGYSGWIVARDGGRTCTACDREIRRGEAYTTDTTRDAQRHVFCPEVTP